MRILLTILILCVTARAEAPDDRELDEVRHLGDAIERLYPNAESLYVTVGRAADFLATYFITVKKCDVARLPLTDFVRLPPDYLERPGGRERMAGGKPAKTKLDQELQERRRRGRAPLMVGPLGNPAERLYEHFDTILPSDADLGEKTVVLIDSDFSAETLRAVGDYFDLYRKARGRKFRVRQIYLKPKAAEPFPDAAPLALDTTASTDYAVDVIDLAGGEYPVVSEKLFNGKYDRYAVVGSWRLERDTPGPSRNPASSLHEDWVERLRARFLTCGRPLRALGLTRPSTIEADPPVNGM